MLVLIGCRSNKNILHSCVSGAVEQLFLLHG